MLASLFCSTIKFHYLQLGTFPAKDSEVFYNPKWKISHHHNKRFKTKENVGCIFNKTLFIVKRFCILNNKIFMPRVFNVGGQVKLVSNFCDKKTFTRTRENRRNE